jgi:hypothetical protein
MLRRDKRGRFTAAIRGPVVYYLVAKRFADKGRGNRFVSAAAVEEFVSRSLEAVVNASEWMLMLTIPLAGVKNKAKSFKNHLQSLVNKGKKRYEKYDIGKITKLLDAAIFCMSGEEGSFLYKELTKYAEYERKRTKKAYMARAKMGLPGTNWWGYICGPEFYKIIISKDEVAVGFGNIPKMDMATSNWKSRYIGTTSADWFRGSVPKYLKKDTGYWRWQEFGAGAPHHWLNTTVEKYCAGMEDISDILARLSHIGGNIRARHIFLDKEGRIHQAQLYIAERLGVRINTEFGKNVKKVYNSYNP